MASLIQLCISLCQIKRIVVFRQTGSKILPVEFAVFGVI